MSSLEAIGRGVLGLAVLGSLGLGATQALAEPRPAQERAACSYFYCHANCVTSGYDYGQCVNGFCQCWFRNP